MQPLCYMKPESLDDALQLLQRHAGKIKVYAGGTDLMVQLRSGKNGLEDVECFLDCSDLKELRGVSTDEYCVRIGAMTTHAQLAENAIIQELAPCLASAAGSVGSPQIRNMGTVGGNICNGSPAADTLTPLVAMDAKLTVLSTRGSRQCLVKDIGGAGKPRLEPDELVKEIVFDRPFGNSVFLKLGRRKALAISRINIAVLLRISEGMIVQSSIAPGCVFSAPDRVSAAEAFLMHQKPSAGLFERAGELISEEMIKRTGIRWSTQYKKPVLEALACRALLLAAGLHEE